MFPRSPFFATRVVICALAVGAPCMAQETGTSPETPAAPPETPTAPQETPAAPQAPVRGLAVDTSRTYTYEFDDDTLTAPGLGEVPKIRVLPRASRQTLLRPRASFIVPLIRSVETVGDPYPAPIRVRVSSYYQRH